VALATAIGCARRNPADVGTPFRFDDAGATTQSDYTGSAPKIEIRKAGEGWLLTAYQGRQSTGGYSIRIERLATTGTILHVKARFVVPAADAVVTLAPTSPAHTVRLPFFPDAVVLYDQDGNERYQATLP
jgi:hypothetical protein